VLQRLGGGRGYFVLTGSDFVAGIRGVLRQLFVATWMLLAVAALIGVIGIATTQVATVLDRAPDNVTLHTIGIPRRAIARGLLVECGILGILGGLLGVAIGVLLAGQLTTWTLRLLTGWRIPLVVPGGVLAGAVVLSTVISALAGWIPARVTMRQRLAIRGIE
jgi:putative ABC transport system permease protein